MPQSITARVLFGLISGAVATGPMTVLMETLHGKLPFRERYPLPPSQIAARLESRVLGRRDLPGLTHSEVAVVAHFAYGASAGAIYSTVIEPTPGYDIPKGAAYGLLLWSISYFGLLPGLGILHSASDQPRERRLLMIAAHLVWGVMVARVFRTLTKATESALAKPRSRLRKP